MDMRANLLTGLCRAKDSDDGNLGLFADLRGVDIVSKYRIELGWSRLVIINTIQPHAEKIHGERDLSLRRAHWIFDIRVHH